MPIVWENIGDPVAKGFAPPLWIREIVQRAAADPATYAYSPTAGLDATRAYIAQERNLEGGIQITADDILFFNGLGDAISKLYTNLNAGARVIGPNPAYPTHSSAEAAHADAPALTYRLDPEKGWAPDVANLEEQIQNNPSIAGILIINPDNPTGFVYPQETLAQMVDIARRYKLFIISDEIYSNLAYDGAMMKKLASVIGEVPGIALRGISKEFPWPGSRCGWAEFYNRSADRNFDRYTRSLIDSKMLEVCSTTLPQKVLPEVMSDARYLPYLAERTASYDRKSKLACEIFSAIPEIILHPAHGAFYLTVVFRDGVLKKEQSLNISEQARAVIAPYLDGVQLDQRFAYQLLAKTGICVVALSSGFNSDRYGFRLTLLEQDDAQFEKTIRTIAENVRAYLDSAV